MIEKCLSSSCSSLTNSSSFRFIFFSCSLSCVSSFDRTTSRKQTVLTCVHTNWSPSSSNGGVCRPKWRTSSTEWAAAFLYIFIWSFVWGLLWSSLVLVPTLVLRDPQCHVTSVFHTQTERRCSCFQSIVYEVVMTSLKLRWVQRLRVQYITFKTHFMILYLTMQVIIIIYDCFCDIKYCKYYTLLIIWIITVLYIIII